MRHPPLRAPPLPPLQADWGQLKSWALPAGAVPRDCPVGTSLLCTGESCFLKNYPVVQVSTSVTHTFLWVLPLRRFSPKARFRFSVAWRWCFCFSAPRAASELQTKPVWMHKQSLTYFTLKRNFLFMPLKILSKSSTISHSLM